MKIIVGIIIFIFISLLVLIIRSKIKINFLIMKDGEDDHIEINARALYGLFKYEKKFPFIDIINSGEDVFEAHIKTNAKVGNIDIPVGEKTDKAIINMDEIHYYKDKIKEIYLTYNKTINYIRRKIIFDKVYWNTIIGTGDAAETAVIIGILWGLKSGILSFINNKLKLDDIDLKVVPNYETTQLKTRLNCIISLKIGYIIIACIKFIIIKIKLEVGEKIEHASN
ncbi:DUF2953 domain-containing protein [Serpentinicella alkaliphila]|uniref:DUF2953 family protein n=1 Tax=Serpentinicella alkaliphila TaxID=1734049 RepID=A0A4R2T7D5_9FIRM|nr:DUF2953 domain-containing protein [Serpentinicella alkaliphila]QUH26574.1 DUF2953 domain-containing protein [Serpentinicella alkaliphila]TCP99059.1 DUF2953 family protein [Serpentinicella alkaliphila]